MLKKSYKALSLILLVILTVGCTSTKPPLQDLSIAKMAVVDMGDIKDDAQAQMYFKKAQDELVQAQKMMQDKEYEDAKFLAQKATADARVAKIKASNAKLIMQINILDIEVKKIKQDFITIDESGGE